MSSRNSLSPAMDEYKLPEPRDETSKNSIYKSRHISLQSRVESIAAESMYDGSIPDIPAIYRQGRSTSYILGPEYPHSYEQEPMADMPPSPTQPMMPPQQIQMSTLHEVFFIGVVAVSHFMTQAALGQTLGPLDIIGDSFGTTNGGELSWMIAGYSLTVGTFILISGRLGDILGHKRVFAFGYAWFGVWSCFAGFAVYPGRQIFFDVCRAMQGLGPALLLPNALALFGRCYPPGIKKNIVFSIFGACAPSGFVVGSVFGSLFAERLWWPWAFWSFGITCWALSAFALLVIPKALSERPVNKPGFDWTGSIVGVVGLVLFNVAWNNGPLFGWGTPHVYFLLIIGLLFFAAFFFVEKRAVSPILPVHALNSTIAFILGLIALGWGAFGIWIFYSYRWLHIARGLSPLSTSGEMVPAAICGVLAGGLTGFLLTHTPVSFVMMISMVAFSVGVIIAGTMPAHQVYWAQFFFSTIVMPFGMDMSFPAATVILSNHMPREHQGLAASLVNTVVNYSISMALGIAGTVEVTIIGNDHSVESLERGMKGAFYTGMALALSGVALGALFFARSMIKEGWKIMDH